MHCRINRLPKWALALVALVLSSLQMEAQLTNLQPGLGLRYYVATGDFPFPTRENFAAGPVFLGELKLFKADSAPVGYTLADGRSLDIVSNQELFALLGTSFGGDGRVNFSLPNLAGRLPIGNGTGPGLSYHRMGEYGGASATYLAIPYLPIHSHETFGGSTGNSGGNFAIGNIQPYVSVVPLIAIAGESSEVEADSTEVFVGEVRWFCGNFAPSGFVRADGQTLPIIGNEELYALSGTIYGGDGRTSFGVPDLRGRCIVNAGPGVNLSDRSLGQKFGTELESIGTANMPPHSHDLPEGVETDPSGGGQAYNNMMPSIVLHHMILPASGEIRFFAGISRFLPWDPLDGTDGQLDLRGRVAVGVGGSYSYMGIDGSETTSLSEGDLPAHTHGSPAYVTWINGYYPGELDLDVVGPEARPDGQVSNLYQYIFGASPLSIEDDLNPGMTSDETHVTYVFRRSSSSGSFEPYVEYGPAPGDWTLAVHGEGGVTVVTETDGFGEGVDKVSVRIPHLDLPQMFARLGVEIP